MRLPEILDQLPTVNTLFYDGRKLKAGLYEVVMKKALHAVPERAVEEFIPIFHLAAQLAEAVWIIRYGAQQRIEFLLRIRHAISSARSSSPNSRSTLAVI